MLVDVKTPPTIDVSWAQPEAPSPRRQMYLVFYPTALEDQVVEVLESAGVPGYTEFPKLLGRGRRLRHFDTAAWPGTTGAILTVVDAEQAERLTDSLKWLDVVMEERSHSLNGLHLFAWPCRQLI